MREDVMTGQDLFFEVERLESRISRADRAQRLALQPQLSACLIRLKDQGMEVPHRLRRLDAALVDEAIEARFDNMPV